MDALRLPAEMPRSRFSVLYAQKDVTSDLSAHLLSLTHTDYLTGQSDELEIELEDVDGRWKAAWYPGKGDTLTAAIGWQGQGLVQVGTFQIDEIEFAGGPSTVCIRALAAHIGTPLRTIEHVAYEATTLDAVAKRIASRHGLELTGKIEPIALDRLTQSEPDGVFLTRLAGEYDYAFKVVANRLVFHSMADLMAQAPIARMDMAEFAPGWRIRDQIKEVPEKVTIKSHHPTANTLVSYAMNNEGTVAPVPASVSKATTSSDTTKRTTRTRHAAQADAKARCERDRANREQTQGSARLQGRPRLVAGSVLALTGAGRLDGHYLIQTSRHCLTRSGGYTTDLDFCRVRATQTTTPVAAPSARPASRLAVYGLQDGQTVRTR